MDFLRRVVIAGHVCIDENITPTATVRAIGSPAAFMAPVLEEQGVEVLVAAPSAGDFGALDVQEARNAGRAPLRMLEPVSGGHTLVFVNDVRGERRIQAVREIDSARLGRPGAAVEEALSCAGALLFAPLLADPRVPVVAEYAGALPAGALRVVLLQGYLRQADDVPDARGNRPVRPRTLVEAADLLPLFDIAVLSDEDAPDVDRVVEEWAAAHPGVAIVVTRGPRGASVYRDGTRQDVPAHPVGPLAAEALIGAGDVFAAELTLVLLGPVGGRGVDELGIGLELTRLVEAVARANRATAPNLVSRPASPARRF